MKKFLAITLAALMVLTLAACGAAPAASSQAETSSAQNAEPVTIKFANYALLEKGYEEFWNGIKTGFEAKNPNIKIEYVTAPYGEMVNQVINMAGGGDKVDLVFGEIGWVPGLEDAGIAAPVDTILSPEFLGDFAPAIIDSHKINGKAYAVPMYVSPYVLYYNKDLFKQAGLDPEKAPATFDEMLKAAEALSKLKDKSGNKVFAFGQTTASVPVSGAALNGMIFNFGGSLLDESGKLSVDNQGFKDAITMLKTLDDKGYNPPNAKLKDLRNLFALGQLGMYYDQSWGFNGVKSINPEAANFTASAKPLAGGQGKGESILQSHCLILADNGDAKKDAVKKLVEYIITPEVLNDYLANTTPAYPAKKSMADSVANNPILKGAAGSAENVKTQTFIPQLSDLNLELCKLAQAVTVSDKPVDASIAEFKKAAEAIINK